MRSICSPKICLVQRLVILQTLASDSVHESILLEVGIQGKRKKRVSKSQIKLRHGHLSLSGLVLSEKEVRICSQRRATMSVSLFPPTLCHIRCENLLLT